MMSNIVAFICAFKDTNDLSLQISFATRFEINHDRNLKLKLSHLFLIFLIILINFSSSLCVKSISLIIYEPNILCPEI